MAKKWLFSALVLSAVFFCALTSSVQAVVIAGGDGSGNTTGTGVAGWDYVGRIGNATSYSSVTYLGNNWFITAYHVKYYDNPSTVILNGSTYNINSTSWTRLQNSDESNADLVLFRVNESVGLDTVTISESTPGSGTDLTMIGNGRDREADLIYWDSSWNEVTSGYTYGGYKTIDKTGTKRWGTNTSEGYYGVVSSTECFYTDFDPVVGEAQAAVYDSGGGVFTGTTGNYELAGIMITKLVFTNQPSLTAVFYNATVSADLSVYRDQILETIAIPEPMTAGLVIAGAAAIFLRRRRK